MTHREKLNQIIQLSALDSALAITKKIGSRIRSVPSKISDFKGFYNSARAANPAGTRLDAIESAANQGLKKKQAGGYSDIPWGQ